MNIILGGNMSSRLFNEIREKRSLAYEIGTSIKQYCDTGSFYIHAGIDNRKVREAVSVMVRELDKIRKKHVTKRELNMAKEYYKSGLLMTLESSMSNMLFLGEQIASVGKIKTKDKILEAVNKVDEGMIRTLAKRIFADGSLRLAAIGPQSMEETDKIASALDA
jgi:predicted Zn-dependent peptidase